MKRTIGPMLLLALVSFAFIAEKTPIIYKDASQPVEKRVEDLLKRMTLEEKVAQMNQFVGLEHMRSAEKDLTAEELSNNTARGFYPGLTSKDIGALNEKGLVGSFLHVLTAEEANDLQKMAQKSRLQIPLLIGIDAIHGNAQVSGCTVYPTNIGLASAFDPALVEKISRETAIEMRATGSHWNFNPNIEIARDPRWGRVGETFGEDTYLVTQLGVACVKGYQGADFTGTDKVLACIKHFMGGTPINGTNGAPADLSERTMREIYFPPYIAGVKAGAFTLMTAHNEVNGIPSHSNKWLMDDILRKEWGFKGFIVSDWMDIEHIHDLHKTAETNKDAYHQSIEAGMDMHMHGPDFFYKVVELVKEGKISEERINESVRKILEAKFKLGLFENPFVDLKKIKNTVFTKNHQQTALDAARKSIVLLKNNGILPLKAGQFKNVFVTGPNANDQGIMGDWAQPQPEKNIITILQGLKMVSPETNFTFLEQGWNIRKMEKAKVDQAAEMAKKADLNIVVVGEHALRINWNDKTGGEDTDRSDIALPGLQQELVEKIHASGKPTIVVLINGRQLGVEWIANNAAALVEAWEPGGFGGQAVAEIIYGKVNPTAKLPITIPRHVGQVQQFYNHKPSMYFHPYTIGSSTPLYPFGYGLSYTTYKYSALALSKTTINDKESVTVSVNVSNTGKLAGEEIVQLYIRDEFSSATRPVKELKDFARVSLAAGENKTISFTLPAEKLAFYDKNMKWGVEPGNFKIMVGSSSEDKDLLVTNLLVK
ncbi:glycoside hydrolase family 3 N-terminal domain-containing protein [Pedobacter xixiisoli]|uniref:beta-glucosidase n=1 Tax=Pedobacter xixiisoli TaxID=1476464 RepID=A0A285ZQX9_9SPHI|nr:glycoside hydrolase family 3 N-terminal domain-containing protein [Pedobacter xixiisoli]SOD12086.1 beta-glucosidase [Pedobacter xixiisoli]